MILSNKIISIKVGYCTHPQCMAIKGGSLCPHEFDANVFLIKTRSGYLLWDTGYSAQFKQEMKGVYKLYGMTTPVVFDPEKEDLVHQLSLLNIEKSDIIGLFVSHYHADHIAGLLNWKGTPLYASQDGFDSLKSKSGFNALINGFIPNLIPPWFEDSVQFFESFKLLRKQELPGELSVFEKGYLFEEGIILIPLPGHAVGHFGLAVLEENGKWSLIASDAAWFSKSINDFIGPSIFSFLIQDNKQQYYRTLNALHKFNAVANNIYLSHEKYN